MKSFAVTIIMVSLLFISCQRAEDLSEHSINGYIEYSINGQVFRFDQYNEDCSVSAVYTDGTLSGIEISGGETFEGVQNTLLISDYQTIASGIYTISVGEAEQSNYVIALNYENTPYAIFWGEGLGVETGYGSIAYTNFQPSERTDQTQLAGSFEFVLFSLANEPVEVTGAFEFLVE